MKALIQNENGSKEKRFIVKLAQACAKDRKKNKINDQDKGIKKV